MTTKVRSKIPAAAILLLVCLLHVYNVAGIDGERNNINNEEEADITTNLTRNYFWWKNIRSGRADNLLTNANHGVLNETASNNTNTSTSTRPKTKKKEKKVKSVRQKIANCRHLASTIDDGNTSRSQLFVARVLRRLSSRNINNNINTQADIHMAYSMGIVATLSYWDFHKKPLPEGRTNFEIMSYRNAYANRNGGLPEPLRQRRGHRRSRAMRLMVSSVRLALDQANPWISLLPPQRTVQRRQRKRNRDDESSSSAKPNAPTSFREPLFDDSAAWKNQQRQHHIQLEYSLYDWYEPTPLGNYHDTDILIATSNNGENLILAFAGTASVYDTVTNLQTFEPAQHSGLFQNKTLEGSIHRGFLNAYSRVERGSILKLCPEDSGACHIETSTPLYRRYGHCTAEGVGEATSSDESTKSDSENATKNSDNTAESITWKRGRGCKVKHRKLKTILRELVIDYLAAGKSVHLTGHSLGGSIATLHALDIIINFPNVSVSKLELWTYGGAQATDDAFLQSALAVATRLKYFLQLDSIMGNLKNIPTANTAAAFSGVSSKARRSQCHRFVTVSDDCKVDFISTVAQKTLAPDNDKNIHGKTARKLGGIRGNSVVHLVDPHYLLTPDQYGQADDPAVGNTGATFGAAGSASNTKQRKKKTQELSAIDNEIDGASPSSGEPPQNISHKQPSSTRSTLAAHSTTNYIKAISRESWDHPLSTNLPQEMRMWLGEIMI